MGDYVSGLGQMLSGAGSINSGSLIDGSAYGWLFNSATGLLQSPGYNVPCQPVRQGQAAPPARDCEFAWLRKRVDEVCWRAV